MAPDRFAKGPARAMRGAWQWAPGRPQVHRTAYQLRWHLRRAQCMLVPDRQQPAYMRPAPLDYSVDFLR